MTLRENNLHVHNTLTRKREPFEPVAPPHVGMYVCGPTVYGDAHIGHAKSYIAFDCIVRYLRYLGYEVTYVQNITDVGHLTDDADEGEDKVEKEAKAKKTHPMAIAETYTRRYFEDMDRLNVVRPDISPRASGHMVEQIEHVKRLLETGHAYEVGGNVYFDVSSWPKYGRLSGRQVEDMQAGARVQTNPEKRSPADFALWKRAEPGHIMQWPSPWGMGYPGWHLECTVMSQKYLGETVDIHGGGIENQFPHHENEIAQAEAASGKPFVKYWLHNNMVTVDGQKMGKSLGNFITLRDAFKKWDPMVLRMFLLQSHYRSQTDISDEALGAAKEGYQRLLSAATSIRKAIVPYASEMVGVFFEWLRHRDPELLVSSQLPGGDSEGAAAEAQSLIGQCYSELRGAMDDDFNTPLALAAIFELARHINRLMSEFSRSLQVLCWLDTTLDLLCNQILGITVKAESSQYTDELNSDLIKKLVQLLIKLRNDARKEKNFTAADAFRKRLDELGIILEDSPDGTTWRFK